MDTKGSQTAGGADVRTDPPAVQLKRERNVEPGSTTGGSTTVKSVSNKAVQPPLLPSGYPGPLWN